MKKNRLSAAVQLLRSISASTLSTNERRDTPTISDYELQIIELILSVTNLSSLNNY